MNKHVLKLVQYDRELTVDEDSTLLDVLKQNGIYIYANCGGEGTCGKCKVMIDGQLSPVSVEEKKYLSTEELTQGIRLACKVKVCGAAALTLLEKEAVNEFKEKIDIQKEYAADSRVVKRITVPGVPDMENGLSIDEAFLKDERHKCHIPFDVFELFSAFPEMPEKATLTFYNDELIDVEDGDTSAEAYGIAVDMGTTTIACYLLNLKTGRQFDVISLQNPQSSFGADLISRINYALTKKDGLKKLSSSVKKVIDASILKLCERNQIKTSHVYECLFVGNTAMNHLFWAISPQSLARLPFAPVTKRMITRAASSVGFFNITPNAKLTFLQNIGGFVGSDTLGCIIAIERLFKDENAINIIVDLGTNGEIVLYTPAVIYVCSTAAGPAFEGARIRNGMQAFSGALNAAWFREDIAYTTINEKPAKGICGSGLIDIICVLMEKGVISEFGEIVEADSILYEPLKKRVIETDQGREVIIVNKEETANGRTITVTQKDIREIQLAKGAVAAGINILLKIAGTDIESVENLYLTGAFGNFINKYNALKMGLLPPLSPEKIISVGNAAGEGAKIALCDKSVISRSEEIMKKAAHIEISTFPEFQEEFIEGMYFR